jgi:hypothetical protein
LHREYQRNLWHHRLGWLAVPRPHPAAINLEANLRQWYKRLRNQSEPKPTMKARFIPVCIAVALVVSCHSSPRFDPIERLQTLWTTSLVRDPHFAKYKDDLQKSIFNSKNLYVETVTGNQAYEWARSFRDNPKDAARWIWYGAPDDVKKYKRLVAVSGGLDNVGWICYFDMKGNLVLFHLIPEG